MGKLFSLDNADDNLWNLIISEKYKIMCINDGMDIKDTGKVMTDFNDSLNRLLPEKCSFEI